MQVRCSFLGARQLHAGGRGGIGWEYLRSLQGIQSAHYPPFIRRQSTSTNQPTNPPMLPATHNWSVPPSLLCTRRRCLAYPCLCSAGVAWRCWRHMTTTNCPAERPAATLTFARISLSSVRPLHTEHALLGAGRGYHGSPVVWFPIVFNRSRMLSGPCPVGWL